MSFMLQFSAVSVYCCNTPKLLDTKYCSHILMFNVKAYSAFPECGWPWF